MRNRVMLIALATVAVSVVALLLLIGAAGAQSPDVSAEAAVELKIYYQGRLEDASGPVNGTRSITFRFYDVASGGTALWQETQSVLVTDGNFSVELGVHQDEFNGQALWLGLQVAGDSEMTPRHKILPVPYALSLVPGAQIDGSNLDATVSVSNTGSFNGPSDIGYDATFSSLAGVRVYAEGDYNYPDPYNGHRDLGVGVYSYGQIVGVHGLSDTGTAGRFVGSNGTGVYAKGNVAVGGFAGPSGTGVVGHSGYASYISQGGVGVVGDSAEGIGVVAKTSSSSDPALWVNNQSSTGDLIHAYSRAGINLELRFKVDSNGNVTADGTYTSPASDFAEMIAVEGNMVGYEPGDVLVISDAEDRAVELASEAHSTAVIGIYSTKPGFVGGASIDGEVEGIPVALTGIVPCKVSAENGPIHRGDLLTTSSTPGYAMKVTDRSQAIGAILGKAMGELESGTGVILVLVMLQ